MKSATASADRGAQAQERTTKRLRSKAASQSKLAAAKLSRTLKGTRRRLRGASRSAGSWNRAGKTVALLFKKHQGSIKGDAYSLADKTAQHIASNMLGKTAQERLDEFKLDCRRHPMLAPENLIVHISLSRPEGHALTVQQWHLVGRAWLKNIGAEGCNYTLTRHPGKHDHAHLVYSRARMDGSLVSDSNDFWRGRAAAREAARSLGIEVPDIAPKPTQAPTDRAVSAQRRAQRRGTQPNVWVRPELVQDALRLARNTEEFAALLQSKGIEFKLSQSKTNKTTGALGALFRVRGSEQWLSGSSINRELTLPKLQAQIELNAIKSAKAMPKPVPAQMLKQRPTPTQLQPPRQRGG